MVLKIVCPSIKRLQIERFSMKKTNLDRLMVEQMIYKTQDFSSATP